MTDSNAFKAFAEWVARCVTHENFKIAVSIFPEMACRKLVELGIVRVEDNNYVYEWNSNVEHPSIVDIICDDVLGKKREVTE